MRIAEVYKSLTSSNLKILVEDDGKEYLAFIEGEKFCIVNLGEDKSIEELYKVQTFVKEFLKAINTETIIPTT